jgi:hypothetical protein
MVIKKSELTKVSFYNLSEKVDSSKSHRGGTDSLKDYYHPLEPVSRQIRDYSPQPISH